MSKHPTHPSQEKEESKEKKAPSYYPVKRSGSVDLGLDTVSWQARDGNLKIVAEMEELMRQLQIKYIGNSSYPLK